MSASTDNTTFSDEVWSGKVFSGVWKEAAGGTSSVVEPATGQQLSSIGTASGDDVDSAAAAALKAQREWAEMPFDQRAGIIRKAAALIEERAEEFHYWNIRECGSIRPKSEWELNATKEQVSMAAALPMQSNGMLFPSSMPQRTNYWIRVPVGTVGVIAPWNFPLLLAMRSVAPALALGNAVILKPDEKSAVTGGALIAKLFADAGLPENVLHVLPGGAETGEAVVKHPDIHMISFTGSTAVGRKIGEVCGSMLKKVALELGGNNALVVLEDADIDAASSNGAWGAYLHQGQICMQAGRHLVHRSVADEYVKKLVERTRNLVVADPNAGPAHLGPLISEKQLQRVADIVSRTVEGGAKVEIGAESEGLFYKPTVLTNVTPDMPAFQDEIFGPVAPITVFDSDQEAIDLINRSPYGLAAAIHTSTVNRGMQLARQLRTGMVHINDQTVNNEFHVPFGGQGASGNGGRFGGPANIEEFTQSQWISSMDKPIIYPF